MNRLLALIPVLGSLWLGTCGVYEGIRDSDGTKLTLVLMWLVTYVLYVVWKRRAIATQMEWMKSVTNLVRRYSATPEPAPGADLVNHDDGGDADNKSEAQCPEDTERLEDMK